MIFKLISPSPFLSSYVRHYQLIHFSFTIIIVAFFPLIIISAAYNQSIVKRILDTRVLQRMGDE